MSRSAGGTCAKPQVGDRAASQGSVSNRPSAVIRGGIMKSRDLQPTDLTAAARNSPRPETSLEAVHLAISPPNTAHRCFAASLIAVANAANPPKISVKTGLSLSTIRAQMSNSGFMISGRRRNEATKIMAIKNLRTLIEYAATNRGRKKL